MKLKLIVAAVAFFAAFGLQAQNESVEVEDNSISTVPNKKVKNINQQQIDFKDVIDTGRINVISFWATWCGPCIKELRVIDEYYELWQEDYDMKFIAVSIDDARNVNKVKPFVLGEGWEYDIILDQNQELARAMNVNNPPMTFVVDQNGKIVYSHQGYTPGAEKKLEEELQKLQD